MQSHYIFEKQKKTKIQIIFFIGDNIFRFSDCRRNLSHWYWGIPSRRTFHVAECFLFSVGQFSYSAFNPFFNKKDFWMLDGLFNTCFNTQNGGSNMAA